MYLMQQIDEYQSNPNMNKENLIYRSAKELKHKDVIHKNYSITWIFRKILKILNIFGIIGKIDYLNKPVSITINEEQIGKDTINEQQMNDYIVKPISPILEMAKAINIKDTHDLGRTL